MAKSLFYRFAVLTLLAGVLFSISSCSEDEKSEAIYVAGFNLIQENEDSSVSRSETSLIWDTYANAFRANGLTISDNNGKITVSKGIESIETLIKTGCEEAESELESVEWTGYYEYAIVGMNSSAQNILLYSKSYGIKK